MELKRLIDDRLAHYRRLQQLKINLARDTRTELRAAIEELEWVQRQLAEQATTTTEQVKQLELV